ncbi:SubName: Full=Uncharacterized protein {ECO:0000313/EMBL:CCA70807.1} [Serendipita indica DSM 11827]|nr:SubName: Full=Uncharacterized protein {ECO:0000313/EMBL:CCA70807.1} [Serendipita indica DSM 11827]
MAWANSSPVDDNLAKLLRVQTTGSSKSKDKQQPSTKSEALTPKEKAARYEDLKSKRAWDLATSPAKQLPMQMIMVYFSGGGVQIFSMGMVAMLLSSPFKAVAGMNEGAETLDDVDMLIY